MQQLIPISCNKDCGAGCPLTAVVENGRVVRVRNSLYKGRYMQGCRKGYAIPEMLYHPRRLVSPLVRTGKRGSGEFREASWEEIIPMIAERITASGNPLDGAVMQLGGSGSCRGAVHNTAKLTGRFLALYGGYTETSGNYSSQAVSFMNPLLFGTQEVGIDIRTLFSSELVILWGFNPADTRFGTETEEVLRTLKRQGVPMVVIDPRRTATVDLCGAEWLPINPGTDSALAAAMIHNLLERRPAAAARLADYAVGYEPILRLITGRSDGLVRDISWAAEICGLPAERITAFTERFCNASPAAVLPGLSIQRTLGGEDTNRMLALLQLAAGNCGIAGGSSGAGKWSNIPTPRCPAIPVPPNPAGREIPVYEWADAVSSGSSGVTMLYNVGGNYAVQSGNSSLVLEAFSQVETIVTHEFFMTPTALWSDFVLPAAMFPERSDICFSSSGLLLFSRQAIEPPPGVKSDYDIFSLLSEELGFHDAFTDGGKSADEWVAELLTMSEVDDHRLFTEVGIWESSARMHVAFSDYIADPERNPLSTPSGRMEFSSDKLAAAGCSEMPRLFHEVVDENFPLYLITPHERYRIHSQNSEIASLSALIDDRLLMHPGDAAARGIVDDNQQVLVRSRSGEIQCRVHLTDAIKPGVVALKSGYWQEVIREGRKTFPGTNTLTDTTPTLPSHGSRTHSNGVEVIRSC